MDGRALEVSLPVLSPLFLGPLTVLISLSKALIMLCGKDGGMVPTGVPGSPLVESLLVMSKLLAGAKIIWMYSCEGLRMTLGIYPGTMVNGANGVDSVTRPCLVQSQLCAGALVDWIFLQLRLTKTPFCIRHGTAKLGEGGRAVVGSCSATFGTFRLVLFMSDSCYIG